MDNLITFIESHDQHFVRYETLSNIKKSSVCNWLYIFDVSYYNGNPTEILPNNTIKFGKTNTDIYSRLSQYNDSINMRNIDCLQCNYPEKREALLKRYMRKKTNYKPVCGKEYFCDCRNYIKVLMLIIASISDEDVILFDTYYKSDNILYITYLDNITETYNTIQNTELYELNGIPENNIQEHDSIENNIIAHICTNCNKLFTTISNLNVHKKTAKYCKQLQIHETNIDINTNSYVCEYCEKEYTTKTNLRVHNGKMLF